jgi:hypothetical protein
VVFVYRNSGNDDENDGDDELFDLHLMQTFLALSGNDKADRTVLRSYLLLNLMYIL